MKTTITFSNRTYLAIVVGIFSCTKLLAALFTPSTQLESNSTSMMETMDWENYYTDLSALETNESMLEQWSERIQELVDQPLNVNSATKEELADLPLMNEKLVEAISYYLYRYGPMKDLAELKLIEGMDEIRYRLLYHLVYPGETLENNKATPTLKTMLKRGKHDIRFQLGTSLEQKKGYKETTSENERYLGDSWSSTVRYGFNYKKSLQFGFTTQKDAGEPWLNARSSPDYFSAHLLIKDMKWCKALIVGDYSLTMGQGLVCGQSFQIGKGSFTGNPGSAGSLLKRHASSGESSYFKGLAFDVDLFNNTLSTKKFVSVSLIGFFSNQRIDGNVVENKITSLITTGLHRTSNEMEKRQKALLLTAGGSLAFSTRLTRIHVNVLSWSMDKKMLPTQQLYNQFQLKGSRGNNLSLDFRFLAGKTSFFGEAAIDQDLHRAFQAGCYVMPISSLSLIFHYRNHGVTYNAMHAGAFGENNKANNERGFYSSLTWEATKQLTLSGYVDVYEFPWLTYSCDEPSGGHQLNIQGLIQLSQTASMLIRLKEKNSMHNRLTPGSKNPFMEETMQRSLRLNYTESMNELEMQTIIDASCVSNSLDNWQSEGYSLSQTIKHTFHSFPAKISAKVCCFDIPDYANRISSYESSLPGSARFSSLYGKGCRLSALGSYTMGKSVQWWLDVSHWKYTDRTCVGTGPEEVSGNHLTMIQLMLRLKF